MKDDEKQALEPRMLTMHKQITTTSDGTRPLIFYTFTEPSTVRETEARIPHRA